MKRFWERVAKLQEFYCCAWCRGRLALWILFFVAILIDKWPGFATVWVVGWGLSYMAYRKHEKDRKERLKNIVG